MTQFPSWVRRGVRPYQGPDRRWDDDSGKGSRVYAIAFDLNTDALKTHYHGNTETAAYHDIRRVLEQHGFRHQQGSMYFGSSGMTAVHCFVAVQDIQKMYPWFARVVRDIRMLRIEEQNDLMPAIAQQDLFPRKAANG